MKKQNEFGKNSTRREFIGQAAAAAVGVTIVPRHVLGGAGHIPPSDKVNIAFIGVGAQGFRVMLKFLKEPDVQGVAVCDVMKSAADYPQWDTHEFCKICARTAGRQQRMGLAESGSADFADAFAEGQQAV